MTEWNARQDLADTMASMFPNGGSKTVVAEIAVTALVEWLRTNEERDMGGVYPFREWCDLADLLEADDE